MDERWLQAFGAVPPIGYELREALPSRWLRIHSLPQSRRYPEDEADYRELLARHNEVATALLGAGEECVLVTSGETKVVTWQPGAFDELIRARADEQLDSLLLANLARRTAYAPYDGGADLFVDEPEAVDRYRQRWREWLAPRPDGL